MWKNWSTSTKIGVATAAIVAAGGSYCYYKHCSKSIRTPRGVSKQGTNSKGIMQGDSGTDNDMARQGQDDDTQQELEQIFQDAVTFVQKPPIEAGFKPTQDQQLQLYGLYKQATEGPCNKEAPSRLDFRNRAKWESWKRLGEMSKYDAKNAYVGLLDELAPQWSSFDLDGTETAPPTQPVDEAGVSVSTMKHVLGDEAEKSEELDHLVLMIQNNQTQELRKALEGSDSAEIRNSSGETLLHVAADEGNLEALKVIVTHASSLNIQVSLFTNNKSRFHAWGLSKVIAAPGKRRRPESTSLRSSQ
eukprot:gb/GECG01008459.1/.p1 GENE.gb/GECG01008459.1/~~gb/GECG01008459.1/.p1  ORF type:complete len:303 (+),score=42.34 gb/GECG01008459.1/:1-909(+)